jgi:CRISPR locus-related DNA-binding protein
MAKRKLLVALLDKPIIIERVAIRRRVDELFLVFSDERLEQAESLIDKFSSFGIQAIPIHVISSSFSNILSSILKALDNQSLDDYQIEFSITSGNTVMMLAATIAAVIVKASILCIEENEFIEISEIWPSELVNLTHKKRQILAFLENYNDPVHQKNISKETDICQSGISRHIRDLELAGYISRQRVARNKYIQITELGSTILHNKQIRKRRIWASYLTQAPMGIQTVG